LLKVGFLLFPNSHLLDLAGPLQALDNVNEFIENTVSLQVLAPSAEIKSYQGPLFSGLKTLPTEPEKFDLLIISGSKYNADIFKHKGCAEGIEWLKHYHLTFPNANIAAVCTGAFFLAKAGVLNHRSCTTHFLHVEQLQALVPTAKVKENQLFVWDNNIATSAGVTAGLDLTLDWIENTIGAEIAQNIARDLLVYERRSSEQQQIPERLRYRNHIDNKIQNLQDAISKAPERDWDAKQTEQLLNLGYRQITTRFKKATNITIKQYLLTIRLELAETLVQENTLQIEQVSEALGFNSTHAFRKAWHVRYGISPREYRKKCFG
jgi:transcriptional regulator GlxA family with amidase domain